MGCRYHVYSVYGRLSVSCRSAGCLLAQNCRFVNADKSRGAVLPRQGNKKKSGSTATGSITKQTSQIVLDALDMALQQRKPKAVIHHSDQGAQYTSIAFGNRCAQMGIRPSMGSVGDAYDNAMCESFFASLEYELLDRNRFQTQAEAKIDVFQYIEGWYNPARRHSALGYLSPINYENKQHELHPT